MRRCLGTSLSNRDIEKPKELTTLFPTGWNRTASAFFLQATVFGPWAGQATESRVTLSSPA
jgi:hypothetical protein